MSAASVFVCPACGAPFDPVDGAAPTAVCRHCGNTVAVPEAFRTRFLVSHIDADSLDALTALLPQAQQTLNEAAALIRGGQNSVAIERLMRGFNLGSGQARTLADDIEAGRPISIRQRADDLAVLPGDASAPDLAAVRALIQQDRTIEAIKRLREIRGLSLKDAKEAVEALAEGRAAPTLTLHPPEPAGGSNLDEVRALMARGEKLKAIALMRERTGLSLEQAREAVEAMAFGGAAPAVAAQVALAAPGQMKDLEKIAQLARSGYMIDAIKMHRLAFGTTLSEAKAAVDALRAQPPRPQVDSVVSLDPPLSSRVRRGPGHRFLLAVEIAVAVILIGFMLILVAVWLDKAF
ncbi:MAG: hypothetical protein JNL73_07775 [Anaerolineales bacterium]|nr:hypothetical protein [Anaerolineales bacterium]